MDCVPFDPTMLDNVMGSYSKDDSTSKEKEDTDDITVPLAKIGAQGSDPIPTQATTPTTPTQPTQPTQPDVPTSDLTVNAKSNLFNGTGVRRYSQRKVHSHRQQKRRQRTVEPCL